MSIISTQLPAYCLYPKPQYRLHSLNPNLHSSSSNQAFYSPCVQNIQIPTRSKSSDLQGEINQLFNSPFLRSKRVIHRERQNRLASKNKILFNFWDILRILIKLVNFTYDLTRKKSLTRKYIFWTNLILTENLTNYTMCTNVLN